ncbi:Xanthine dehydrogenase, iron-sulfur cluster and FAD-binding subunit A [Hyphomicrobiales bacterium]|nr:Xanthine dehydrogenase, iron-sulfur cluster and FAD-binding subunit A [Hyphomicrobiales bacterium]CAH1700733.1 Xanthine dehydrogenase, iron-sulfur cluster and FAD-binding subunit A [Hyphomicrobiales bacterium]CAI0344606.1 xanthine dehydrogenase small subunit [Hyphomicrobiales bacterium]
MRESLRFLLGDRPVEIASCDPTLTVLDWLRLDQRMTGSKEGCAEGDCGACTVVVGRLDRGRLRYEAINACIRFLPTLDGCQLLTVEHLKNADGSLHPVQQAMVECHGSQCGFCTPGFVMSLLALRLNEAEPGIGRIEDALAGNLCRCTGYEPIIAAGRRMDEIAPREADRFLQQREAIAARLAALNDGETLALQGEGGRFYAPATIESLAELVTAHPQATLVAGATDVGLWVTKAMKRLDPVIYLGRIEALRAITDKGDHLRLGAMASHIDVRTALAGLSLQLDELMRRFGGEQVRNAGTIGGNIANGSPIGDLPPALIALGATLVLARRSEAGIERRSIPLESFFIEYRKQDRRPGEFVEAVLVPKLAEGALFHVSKVSKRFDEDISAVCGAFRLAFGSDGRISEARLAYGGMAGIPKRAAAAEAALTGQHWNEAAVGAAIAALPQDFTPLDDMRASAQYRLKIAGNLLRRFLIETTQAQTQTRVAGLLAEAAHG